MTNDPITPARLRELADNAFDAEFRVLQAALRAAADRIVSLESQSNATQIAYQAAARHLADALNTMERMETNALENDKRRLATLAAREALLRRALINLVRFAEDFENEVEVAALAAEIAAALEETDNA